jgi:hypothetical protein
MVVYMTSIYRLVLFVTDAHIYVVEMAERKKTANSHTIQETRNTKSASLQGLLMTSASATPLHTHDLNFQLTL